MARLYVFHPPVFFVGNLGEDGRMFFMCFCQKMAVCRKMFNFADRKTTIMLRNASSYRLQDINPRIFWDMELGSLDYEKNAPLIIQRVLEYGDLKDWYAIKKHYGLDRIVSISQGFRTLDPVAVAWLCCLSNTKQEDFRCYRIAQLNPTLWNS